MFAHLMLFLCVLVLTMWSGKIMQLMCNLPFGILLLSAIRMMFLKIILAVCMLVCIVVLAKANPVSSVNCVQSEFLKFVNVCRFVAVCSHVVC